MYYSNHPEDVRVDFFDEKGRWLCTDCLTFLPEKFTYVSTAFTEALQTYFRNNEVLVDNLIVPNSFLGNESITAVCLHPYHEAPYPLMKTFTLDSLFEEEATHESRPAL